MNNQIFKEEQELLYLYMVLTISSKYGNLDEVIRSNNPNLGGSELKLIGTSRLAFVGDMQKELDETMECSNMERWAISHSCVNNKFKYAYVFSIKKISFFKKIWNKAKNMFKSKKQDSFEDFLFGDRDSTIIEPDGFLISLKDFFSITDESEINRLAGKGFFKK